MISDTSYRKALLFALGVHLFLAAMLLIESSTSKPSLTIEAKNTPAVEQQAVASQTQEIIKAVSVDNKEVMETVNRLKEEREAQKTAEMNRQKELTRQVEAAKQQRIKEQQHIAKLKEEANKIAIARKKQVEEEKKHLKELAEQQALEAKRVEKLKKEKEELVKQKQLEAKKLAELNKKKAEEKAKADKLKAAETAKAEKLRADKAAADLANESKRKADAAAAQQAQANADAARNAQIAGEVDRYKALILNAISRKWILPDNVDKNLTCQFRIRLAADGTVLEVSLTQTSGNDQLDRSAKIAIQKASPLPMPADAELINMFRDIKLNVHPEQIRG